MLSSIDLVLQTVLSPAEAIPRLRRQQPVLTVLVVLALASLSESLATLLVARASTGAGAGVAFLVWDSMLNMLGFGLLVVIGAVFLPFSATHVMKGRGQPGPFFWILALSYSPCLLWAGLGLCFQLTPLAGVLWFLAHLALMVWIVAVQVAGLAAVFRLTTLRALFALVLGYGLAVTLFVAANALGFLGFFGTIATWVG